MNDVRNNIEQFILGALVHSNKNFDFIAHIIDINDFASDVHKSIFSFIKNKLEKGGAIDVITLTHFICNKDIDKSYIEIISNSGKVCSNITEYAKILKELSVEENLLTIANTVQQQYKDTIPLEQRVEWFEKAVLNLNSVTSAKRSLSFQAGAIEALDEVQDFMNNKRSNIHTKFAKLDSLCQGFRNGELICLAGRPSVGKTSMALQWALNSMDTARVCFISLEMPIKDISLKIVSHISGVPLSSFITGKITTNTLHECMNKVHNSDLPLWICDDRLTLSSLRTVLREHKRLNQINLVIIDYLQLIENSDDNRKRKDNREQEISEISRFLKHLAKELDLPIIALSQMSRDIEKRSEKEPKLSDLRGSGAIEQDADKVIFIYRTDVEEGSNMPFSKEINLSIAKNRNGPIGIVKFLFNQDLNQFIELEEPSSSI